MMGCDEAVARPDMDRIVAEFVTAAQRGAEADFDLLELHCAHGYLLFSFLSPTANHRTDEYGGPLDSRVGFSVLFPRAACGICEGHATVPRTCPPTLFGHFPSTMGEPSA